MKLTNYAERFIEVKNIELDEKYALVSHAIQLDGTKEAEKYISMLEGRNIYLDKLASALEINIDENILGVKNPKFTFIDLFAGIGGFRIAMQSAGGRCVFSSEWDEAAKETYFDNYGEVPFGDITKPEIKALIPDYFDGQQSFLTFISKYAMASAND